ncbi:class IV lanthionine synthetase LanL [Kitasatospora sp. RB6PN24]|uniref:class IV lanthionine synthetase LanL n=1 Tax=Kitasatospora humi TaxID=2893891 RepID=UPI001E2FA2C2|nr:class IV lanthionine synthetase LanL [Kitasatospora humi]MCC9311066.1 class IV lanthionine synthetase LanL [Kitasatospora humi]
MGDAWRTGTLPDDTLVEVARAAVTGAPAPGGAEVAGGWGAACDGFWCTVRPPTGVPAPPAQGWKIHVSAAGTVATEVLSAVAGVIAEDPCTFKFAADREKLHQINSRNSERGSAGKFITVYPADDDQFLRLAEELHRATEGMPGPVVLSDRPFAPGSLVHYRYGAFSRRAELGNDGAYRSMLHGPDGERFEDVRTAGYRCPPWVVDPTLGAEAAVTDGARRNGRRGGGGVLVGGRFALTAAIRHSAKGGVFLGTDTTDGTSVVVKQARAHIEVDRAGTEARSALRHEARMLAELAGLGLTAEPLELIEQQDSLLLVQQHIPGQSLGSWVAARLTRDGAPDVPWDQAQPMALALVDLLERVHAAGVVLRDLSPGNVLVRPDRQLCLVDLELACPEGRLAGTAGTPGYRAPEQRESAAVAEKAADLFALGGLFFLLATGHDPLLPEQGGSGRPVPQRLDRWLDLAARTGTTARRLAPLVRELRAERPEQRATLTEVRRLLGAPAGPPPAPAPQPLDRLLGDGLRRLAETATPHRPDRLWPTVPNGQRTDPCNVQHGAAGVLAVLARGLAVYPSAAPTVRQAARWIERRCAAEPVVLPGLHFGRSGVAWALLDAAEALHDEAAAERARRLAEPVPHRWPNPDVCHGAAGAGFLRLRLGDHRAALDGARGLLAAAVEEPYGTVWPVPQTFDSSLAGITHLGYGHGVAGVGAFLLAVHRATGDAAALAGAERAARTLAATARTAAGTRYDGEGAAWWPQSAADPASVRLAHWCNGSSGVGSFLLRYWQATGDGGAGDLARAAGQAVLDNRWHCGTSACHGLAGDGEYLLDLAGATGETRFADGAREFAELLSARAVLRDGLLELPDETGTGCAAGYGTGTAGPLAFLLRLLHGGPRLWVDPVGAAAPVSGQHPTARQEPTA